MSLFDSTILAAASAPTTAAPLPIIAGLGDDAWRDASAALAPLTPADLAADMHRPFLPWQEAAFNFADACIARWGCVLLGDDMGMGKTQVILALAAHRLAQRFSTPSNPGYVICIAPPVADHGYYGDLHAAFPGLTMHVVKGHKRSALPAADIYFISDDSRTLTAWLTDDSGRTDKAGKAIRQASDWVMNATLIARDEIHRDKGNNGRGSARTKTMMIVGEAARNARIPFVGASGTLTTNRSVDAYWPLQIVGGKDLLTAVTPGASNVQGFLWRYCAPTQGYAAGGRKFTNYNATDPVSALELHEYLRRTVYVRREKRDLGEGVLPNQGTTVVPLALPKSHMGRYLRVEKDYYNLLLEEKGRVWADKAMRAQAITQMNSLWEEAGVAKAEAAAEYIIALLKDEERSGKVIAFYYHTRVWERLYTHLLTKGIRCVSINGDVTGDARRQAIEDFQAGDAQVCLGQIRAAGAAVTLTAAADAVFVQTCWAPGDIAQAMGRNLRVDDITMARAAEGVEVTYHVLQAAYDDGDDTFDMGMWAVIRTKIITVDAINAGREVTMPEESIQEQVLQAWTPTAKRHGGF